MSSVFAAGRAGVTSHCSPPLLDAEDVVYMKALEADDADAKSASVAKKTALRDAPAASAINAASDIAGLKAAWDTSVLGDSPYA